MSEARFWLLKIMWRIFTAPFYYVGFADFWIADQLNSLAVAFKDFHYFMCFYLTSHDVFTSKYSTRVVKRANNFQILKSPNYRKSIFWKYIVIF